MGRQRKKKRINKDFFSTTEINQRYKYFAKYSPNEKEKAGRETKEPKDKWRERRHRHLFVFTTLMKNN